MLGLLPLLAALSSCEAYHPLTLDPQATAASFSHRSLDDHQALAAAGSRKNDEWQLRALQQVALIYHPEIAVAKAKAQTSLAAITTADTAPNPTLAFTPEYGNHPGAGISPWILGFSPDITLETAGKRRERTGQARAAANSAVLSVVDKSWTVAAAVRTALLEYAAAGERLAILDEQRNNDDEILTAIRSRVAAGEAPHSELAVYQTQSARNAVDLADGRSRVDAARAKLADALGLPVTGLKNRQLSFGPLDHLPEPPDTKVLRRAALLNRPDILAGLEDYNATEAGLRLEIAKQYPDIHLNPGYTFDQSQSKWALGFSLTLPVDRNRGPIREALAKRAEAAATFERLQIGIRGELDQALAAYRADRKRLAEMKALVVTQEREASNAAEMVNRGEAPRSNLLEARGLVIQARLAAVDAGVQAQQSLGQLQDSARIPFGDL